MDLEQTVEEFRRDGFVRIRGLLSEASCAHSGTTRSAS